VCTQPIIETIASLGAAAWHFEQGKVAGSANQEFLRAGREGGAAVATPNKGGG